MFEWAETNASWLTAAGICWDISGGILLTKGLIITDDEIARRSQNAWGITPGTVRALCEQKIDAGIGLAQILFGFVLQLIAAAGVSLSGEVSLVVVFPIVLVWHYYRRNFQYWTVVRTLRLISKTSEEHIWRRLFHDVPENTWISAKLASGVVFKENGKQLA